MHFYRTLFLLAVILQLACDKSNDTIEKSNAGSISKISSQEFSFNFEYNVDGNLFFINQERLFPESGPVSLNVYVKKIGKDSLILGRLRNSFIFDPPTLTVKLKDEKIIQVKRHIPSLPASSTMNVTYETDKIRISMVYQDGSTMQKTRTYGDYFLDANGNVNKIEKFRDTDNGTGTLLFETVALSYDSANNPWQGLVYPLLFCTDLPQAKFFSRNNINSRTINGNLSSFEYIYDADNRTISGDVEIFNSCSIPNRRFLEAYEYVTQ